MNQGITITADGQGSLAVSSSNGTNHLPITLGRYTRLVPTHQVVRLEGDGCYTRAYLKDGRAGLLTLSLWQAGLIVPGFWRLHKSHLVNPAYVAGRTVTGAVRLNSGGLVPVARRRAKDIRSLLKQRAASDLQRRNS